MSVAAARSVASRVVDPRILERRAEVVRHRTRRRRGVVVAILALAVLVVGGWVTAHSRLLSARVVTVSGAVHTPVADVVAAAGLSSRPPLIDVGGAAVAGVEHLPWVATAEVSRRWPDGVRITVVERTPVAAVVEPKPQSGWALVDRTGRVLTRVAAVPAGLVTVSGASPPGPPGSTLTGAKGVLEVAASLPPALHGVVAGVTETGGAITLHLTSPVTVDLGSTVDLHQKFEDAAAVLAGATLPPGAEVDVTVPGEPAVRG